MAFWYWTRNSMRGFVRRSIGPSIRQCWSVGPLVRKQESKTSVLEAFYVCVGRGAGGRALGVDGSWLPLPPSPQQLCDPVSLVLCIEA